MNPPKPAASSGAPTNSPYLNTLDRWYSPYTQQQITEKSEGIFGEQNLMRTGQTALGIAGGAAATAAAVPAAAAILPASAQSLAGLGAGATGGNMTALGTAGTLGQQVLLPAGIAYATTPAAAGEQPAAPVAQQPAAPVSQMTDAQGSSAYPRRMTMGLSPEQIADIERRHSGIVAQSDAQYRGTTLPEQQQTSPVAQQPAQQQAPQQQQTQETAEAIMQAGAAQNATPEQKQTAQTAARQWVQERLTDEDRQGLAALAAGNANDPSAQAFQAKVDASGNEFIKQEFQRLIAEYKTQTGVDPNAQDQGGLIQQAIQGYQNMPEPMKWMMGIGIGGGMLGILSSLFGGGGGAGLLGLLGLGVAGMSGAAGGMFGEAGSNFAGDAITQLGQLTGVIPKDVDLSALKGDAVANALAKAKQHDNLFGKAHAFLNPQQKQQQIKAQLREIENLNWLQQIPVGPRARLIQNIALSRGENPAVVKEMIANADALHAALNNPEHELGKRVLQAREYNQNPEKYINKGISNATGAAYDAVRGWLGYPSPLPEHIKVPESQEEEKTSFDVVALWRRAVKEAEDKDIKEWVSKFRARGRKGRWVNTQRSSKAEKRVMCNN